MKNCTLFCAILLLLCGCQEKQQVSPGKVKCFVGIPPYQQCVEKIAGDLLEVHTLLEPGRSPATYAPSQKKLSALSEAKIYFYSGVPFEKALKRRLGSFPVEIVDLQQGMELRTMEGEHFHGENGHFHHHGEKDPHVWLDPKLMQQQAETIAAELAKLMPQHRQTFVTNLQKWQQELQQLHEKIAAKLAPWKNRTIWVYHPAYGYFTDRYHLKQVAIEIEGKEPAARRLTELMDAAKKDRVATLFVQKQFAAQAPKVLAQELGCQLLYLDPLAKNYQTNLAEMAHKIAQSFQP